MELVYKAFDISNPSGKLFARYATVILWVIGSLYLMSMEYSKPKTDWLSLFATPFLWSIIIAIPVLAMIALKESVWNLIVSILLIVAAFIGSSLMLYGTISRQADYRDSNIVNTDSDNKKRIELDKRLLHNHKMLDEELQLKKKKCDTNSKFDCDQIEASIKVYKDAVEGVKRDLDKLGSHRTPLAGETRISDFIAFMWGYDKAKADYLVAAIAPLLFGFFIEFGAFATAIYGFHNMGLFAIPNRPLDIDTQTQLKLKRIQYLEHKVSIQMTDLDKSIAMHELATAKKDLIAHIQKG